VPIANLGQGKFCIFCGEKPQLKNKEHIIPQWLIKKTGDLNREFNFGINFSNISKGLELEKFKFSFNKFHFPSCKVCNDYYGTFLEEPAKYTMDKIFNHESISFSEITSLLTWFDKIRTGLWLAFLYLNKKDLCDFYPHFFISSSIGLNDRMLAVYRLSGHPKGITILGTSTISFMYYPFCFGIVINDLLFIQASYPGLLSKNMGFPYPGQAEFVFSNNPDGTLHTPWGTMDAVQELRMGIEKVKLPLLRTKLTNSGIEFYQTVINKKLCIEEEYSTEYVKSNSICLNDNLYSKIWANSKKTSNFLDEDINVIDHLTKIYPYHKIRNLFEIDILRIQNVLIDNSPFVKNLPKEIRRQMHSEQVLSRNSNNIIMKFIREECV